MALLSGGRRSSRSSEIGWLAARSEPRRRIDEDAIQVHRLDFERHLAALHQPSCSAALGHRRSPREKRIDLLAQRLGAEWLREVSSGAVRGELRDLAPLD